METISEAQLWQEHGTTRNAERQSGKDEGKNGLDAIRPDVRSRVKCRDSSHASGHPYNQIN